MKYLIIMPDYTGSCIRDEFEKEISLYDLELPRHIIDDFNSWHSIYRKIIPLNVEDREKIMNQIEKLDIEGIELAKKLKSLIPGGAKIKYFSEGKMKYLYAD